MSTIDDAGRVAIPEDVLRQAGLVPGNEVTVTYRDGHIEIEPMLVPMHLERQRGLLVIVPDVPVPPMSREQLQETIDAMRAERGRID